MDGPRADFRVSLAGRVAVGCPAASRSVVNLDVQAAEHRRTPCCVHPRQRSTRVATSRSGCGHARAGSARRRSSPWRVGRESAAEPAACDRRRSYLRDASLDAGWPGGLTDAGGPCGVPALLGALAEVAQDRLERVDDLVAR